MVRRIVVDPITRIEGHLRVEAIIDGGRIKDAYSSGTMVRGVEIILKGRDPRDAWAFTQRICGVCTTVHAIASVRAVENALGITVPPNAELIRNLMFCAHMLQDHVVHFYHLHAVDWVDVVEALKADPAETSRLARSLSSWPKSSPSYFKTIQDKLKYLAETDQLGIFNNGYWGHPAYKLPPEVNLLAVAHYLEALQWQREIVKVHTVFGGKNPHPSYLVGGVPCAINLEESNALNVERLSLIGTIIKGAIEFVENVYLPDLIAIASFYKDWAKIGAGLKNYLAWGDLPTGYYKDVHTFKFRRGAVLNGNLDELVEVDPADPEGVEEYVTHSWYKYSDGDDKGKHPWEGETVLNYTGPKPPFEFLNTDGKYSWIKTPRWKGIPMEVGPLARIAVLYAAGVKEARELVDWSLKKLELPKEALFSTLGRTLARGLETKLTVHWMKEFYDMLIANIKNGDTRTFNRNKWDPSTWPKEAKGVGTTEAPRGALAHYVVIKDGKIANYQAVVPTTWNASPRDAKGQRSAYEAALLDTPIADPEKPLEILRTIHSFDPCIACAVHVIDRKGKELIQVRAV